YIFSGEVFGGTQKTLSGSAFFGSSVSGWEFDLTGLSYQTRGYITVDQAQRGPADRFSGTRSSNYSARIGRKIGEYLMVFVRPSYFGEVRTNGTGLQTNRTHIRQLVFGGELDLEKSLAHSR